MDEVHLEATTYTVRLYADGKHFESRDPYDTVLTIHMLGPHKCYIFGCLGHITAARRESLYGQLKAIGVETILMERCGVDLEIKL